MSRHPPLQPNGVVAFGFTTGAGEPVTTIAASVGDHITTEITVILEDDHGSVSGTANAVLSPDGTKLYMNNGKIVLTEDFTTVSEVPETTFAVELSAEGTKLYTSTRKRYAIGSVNVLDATTFNIQKQWEVGFLASRIFQHNDALYIFAEVELPGTFWRFYKVKLSE